MATGGDTENGRVLAVLGQKIDALTEQVKGLSADIKESNKCMNQLAIDGAMRETRLDTAENEIKNLRAASNRNDVLTGIVTAIVATVASIFGGRQ